MLVLPDQENSWRALWCSVYLCQCFLPRENRIW